LEKREEKPAAWMANHTAKLNLTENDLHDPSATSAALRLIQCFFDASALIRKPAEVSRSMPGADEAALFHGFSGLKQIVRAGAGLQYGFHDEQPE
jgi:hypothetical protein